MEFVSFIKKYRKHPVVGNIRWQFISNFFRTVFALISAVLLTRYLGPEDYGFYSFVLALFGMFTLFSRAGADDVGLKYLTKDREEKDLIIGSVMVWRTLVWVVGFMILTGITLFEDTSKYWYTLLLYGFLFFAAIDALDSFFLSKYKNGYAVMSRLFVEFISLCLKIYLVLGGYPLSYFIYLMAVQTLIHAVVVLGVYIYDQRSLPRFRISRKYFMSIGRESLPMFFAIFMMAFYMRIDQIMISYMINDTVLGYYSAASRISIMAFTIPVVFARPMQVKFLELGAAHVDYNRWLEYYINLTTKIAYLVALVTTLTAPFVIPLLFGAVYKPSVPILMVQIWACIFAFQGAIRKAEIVNHHKPVYNLIAVSAGAAVNVALNFVFIPMYGAIGAAVATIISQCVAVYLTSWALPSLRPIAGMQTRALFLAKAPILKE